MLLLTLLTPAWAGEPPPVIITSILGNASEIEITRPDGYSQVPSIGADLPRGTQIRTGPSSSLRVKFQDGSEMTLRKLTQWIVDSTYPGQVSSELVSGKARATVPPAPKGAPAKGPHRFIVRTKSIVMGVRGTDFFVESRPDSGKVSIHTIEGTVEAAAKPEELTSNPPFRLEAGRALHADADGSGKITEFDRTQYLRAELLNEGQAAETDLPWWLRAWNWIVGKVRAILRLP